jgi:hypothetical protein
MWVHCKRCAMLYRWWAAAHHKVIYTNLQQKSRQASVTSHTGSADIACCWVSQSTTDRMCASCGSGQRQHIVKCMLHAVQMGCLLER